MLASSSPQGLIGSGILNIDRLTLKRRQRELADLKVGDGYRLDCGHEGRVVWVSEDNKIIGVAGVNGSCRSCGKKSSGNWTPTVYLIRFNDEKRE